MHSHGWGGVRTTRPGRLRDAGSTRVRRAVLRPARVRRERRPCARREPGRPRATTSACSCTWSAGLRWVQQDGPRRPPARARSAAPTAAATSSSAPSRACARRGTPVLDALAPEITWYDLSQSLAPEGVVRTAWALALSAAARCPPTPCRRRSTRRWSRAPRPAPGPTAPSRAAENLVEFFRRNGPAFHVAQGRRLDIPVLLGQGTTDSLFPLQQGLANWQQSLTREGPPQEHLRRLQRRARAARGLPPGRRSSPPTRARRSSPAATFGRPARPFFDEQLKGRRPRPSPATVATTWPPRRAPARPSTRSSRTATFAGRHRRHHRPWSAHPLAYEDRRRPDPGRGYAVPHRPDDRARA